MIHRSRARSSSLFLMELILAILFFSVASAVCGQFFVKSHIMSQSSEVLTHAVNECSGMAEMICTADGMTEGMELLQKQYPQGDYPESGPMPSGTDPQADPDSYAEADVRLYYDDSFVSCGQESAAYVLEIHLAEREQMIEAVLEMREAGDTQDDASIYQLTAKHHIARRTGYDER